MQFSPLVLKEGVTYYPEALSQEEQKSLISILQNLITAHQTFQPTMPKTGQPMSVKMLNCGRLGWVSDKNGYRYQDIHPGTGKPWPEMPKIFLEVWEKVSESQKHPDAALINLYQEGAKMGLHQDRDETDFEAPVVSISLGASCLFRMGGLNRKDKTQSLKLHSGDVLVFGGANRLMFHGVDRLLTKSPLCEGRINITLRVV